ncbi:angiotensin-converting enzyme-like [Ornithodoros turicata]|uniref:angiotensin-converting enzyme-like n=1 Tax=Ornithodoros turicata TaxID=34597 RepID=UPI003139D808
MKSLWYVGVFLLVEHLRSVEPAKARCVTGIIDDEERAVEYLKELNGVLTDMCTRTVVASWNYATNLTEYNKNQSIDHNVKSSILDKEIWANATMFNWESFKDPVTRRVFKEFSTLGTSVLPEEKLSEFIKLTTDMAGNHGGAKICPFVRVTNEDDECNVSLEPTIKNMLQTSKNPEELLHLWNEWRAVAGKPVKEKYLRYIELENEAARLNGFKDASEMWLDVYEHKDLEKDLEELWNQVRPLYEQLHAYVRTKLRHTYGEHTILKDGPIPAHLLGHIHSQVWTHLNTETQPYPNKPTIEVTETMKNKNMTQLDMFKLSEEFFTSMGLLPMPESFWEKSVIKKPTDREVICHASAWDFCANNDVRIKQCTQVKMDDLLVVHHEMGHVEYFLQYAKQPYYFRAGANPGFHEAIGDTIALAVATPKHLKSIGLLENSTDDAESDINYLYSIALSKIATLPAEYIYDLWRWNVFRGVYATEELNEKWWELLFKYQGICPGVKRTSDDFDPPSKYHISASVPYIRYFVSTILQFQFYKSLCEEAHHDGPLHTCDFYQSKEAGKLFSEMLQLGKSVPWPDVLSLVTKGKTNKMDARPMLEYFEPLMQWLRKENEGETIGWKSSDPTVCPSLQSHHV